MAHEMLIDPWIPSASRMNYLNASLLIILCTSCIHGVDKDDIKPLQTVRGDQQALQSLWRDLSQGKSNALLNVDGALFLDDIGISNETQGVVEHWTRALPRLLSQHSDKAKALSALDKHFLREISLQPPHAWPQIAIRYLPAPAAQRILEHEANRFFDRGQFIAFLAITNLLADAGAKNPNPHHPSRIALAEAAIQRDTESPWSHELPTPGPLRPLWDRQSDQTTLAVDNNHTHNWSTTDNFILALDPYDQVLWQRPLHPRSQTWFGPHHALILSPYGLELLTQNGASQALKMPTSVRPLAIIGASGWFQNESTVYRLNLDSGNDFIEIKLPDSPLCAPLVAGDVSLWLLPHEIILLSDGHIKNRYLHGIDTRERPENWSLHFDHHSESSTQIMVQNTDQSWLLATFPEEAIGPLRVEHLNRAGRHAEALVAWETLSEVERKQYSTELAVALCALGPASNWSIEKALRWIEDPKWSLRVAVALGRYPDQPLQVGQSVIDLALKAPSTLVPLKPYDLPLHPSHDWDWVMSGAGFDYAHKHRSSRRFAWTGTQKPIEVDAPKIRKLVRKPHKHSREQRYLGNYPLSLGFSEDSTEIGLFTEDRAHLLWQQRWTTPAYLPGRSVALRQDVLIVTEGQSRIHVVNPNNGEILLKSSVPNGLAMPNQTHWIGNHSLAILSPIGVNNLLTIVDQNHVQQFKLPQPAKWSAALDSQILIADFAGVIRSYPDNVIIDWHGEIPNEAPMINENGLFANGLHWKWKQK